jgi:hypothetical protein
MDRGEFISQAISGVADSSDGFVAGEKYHEFKKQEAPG